LVEFGGATGTAASGVGRGTGTGTAAASEPDEKYDAADDDTADHPSPIGDAGRASAPEAARGGFESSTGCAGGFGEALCPELPFLRCGWW
jgi:hypothetical protein